MFWFPISFSLAQVLNDCGFASNNPNHDEMFLFYKLIKSVGYCYMYLSLKNSCEANHLYVQKEIQIETDQNFNISGKYYAFFIQNTKNQKNQFKQNIHTHMPNLVRCELKISCNNHIPDWYLSDVSDEQMQPSW